MKQLYDIEKIKKVLYDFYQVTNRQIALFDENCNPIINVPNSRCEFCQKIRENADGQKACERCDVETIKKSENESFTICRCHAGLIECCAHIRDEYGIVGYLMFGQMLSDKNVEDQYVECKKKSEKYFGNEFEKYYSALPHINEEKLNSMANIMVACIGYIYLKKMINTAFKGVYEQILYFIDRNLANDISLKQIADEINMSTSSVFKIIKKNANISPSHLIVKRRIAQARELLANNDLSITKIADSVGIHDYNYFSRVFKRETGYSPTNYRKLNKK